MHFIGQVDAILRREYGIRPERLTDEEWVKLYAEYKFTEKQKLVNLQQALKAALAEVLNAAFGGRQ